MVQRLRQGPDRSRDAFRRRDHDDGCGPGEEARGTGGAPARGVKSGSGRDGVTALLRSALPGGSSRPCWRTLLTVAAGGILLAATVLLLPLHAFADTLPAIGKLLFEETTSPAPAASVAPNLSVSGGQVYFSWVETPAGAAPSFRFATWDGTRWSDPRTVVSDPKLVADPVEIPSLLVLSDGTIVAAWLKSIGGAGSAATEVMVSTSRDGGVTWAPALRPHRDGSQTEHGFTSLTADPVEGFWAVWLDGRNTAARSAAKSHTHSGAPVYSKSETAGETQLRAALWRGGAFGPEV